MAALREVAPLKYWHSTFVAREENNCHVNHEYVKGVKFVTSSRRRITAEREEDFERENKIHG